MDRMVFVTGCIISLIGAVILLRDMKRMDDREHERG